MIIVDRRVIEEKLTAGTDIKAGTWFTGTMKTPSTKAEECIFYKVDGGLILVSQLTSDSETPFGIRDAKSFFVFDYNTVEVSLNILG